MGLAPSLDCGGKEGVADTEGSGDKHIGGRGVGVHVIAVKIPVLIRIHLKILVNSKMLNYLEQDEVVLVHDLLAQHHGEELVVGDVLDEGGNNVTRLL